MVIVDHADFFVVSFILFFEIVSFNFVSPLFDIFLKNDCNGSLFVCLVRYLLLFYNKKIK